MHRKLIDGYYVPLRRASPSLLVPPRSPSPLFPLVQSAQYGSRMWFFGGKVPLVLVHRSESLAPPNFFSTSCTLLNVHESWDFFFFFLSIETILRKYRSEREERGLESRGWEMDAGFIFVILKFVKGKFILVYWNFNYFR